MNESDVVVTLGQRLQSDATLPLIVWEDQEIPATQPYLAVTHIPTGRQDRTLAANQVELTGFMQVAVVTKAGGTATKARRIAEQVIALFPAGLRLTAGTGTLTLIKPSEVGQGYRDGADWRTPVKIYYHGM